MDMHKSATYKLEQKAHQVSPTAEDVEQAFLSEEKLSEVREMVQETYSRRAQH